MNAERKLSEIKIGHRFRKDLGDVEGLGESVERVGLLQPICINPDGKLIDGFRRLWVFKDLGRKTIPVHTVDIRRLLDGEHDANMFHKGYTPSERVAIADAIEKLEKADAKERQKAGQAKGGKVGGRGHGKGDSFQGSSLKAKSTSQFRDRVAARVGTSARTLNKTRVVVQAAKDEPEKYQAVKDDMDRTGKVDAAHKKVLKGQGRKKEPKEAKSWLNHIIAHLLCGTNSVKDAGGIATVAQALTAKEAASFVFELTNIITILTKWRKCLQEKTK